MRYEIMRLMQFLFSLSLLVGAFAGGLLVGWYRWGVTERDRAAATRRSQRWPTVPRHSSSAASANTAVNNTLFAPQYDEEFDDAYGFERDLFDVSAIDLRPLAAGTRAELTVGDDSALPTIDMATE